MAAVQLVPTLAVLPGSSSTAARLIHPAGLPLPLSGVVTWLVPNVWGNQALMGAYWGPINYNESVHYAGAVALVLAAVALLGLRQRKERGQRVFLALVVVGMLLLLYGLPPVSWLTRLPGVSVDAWSRLNLLAILGIAALAGYGVEDILDWAKVRPFAGNKAEGGTSRRKRRRVLVLLGMVSPLLVALWSV